MSPSETPRPADDRASAESPAPPLKLVGIAILALGLGVGLAQYLESANELSVPSYLQVRTTFVTADRVCRVTELQQSVGERIAQGDPLIAFSDTALEQQTAKARELVDTLAKELSQAEARAKLELAQHQQSVDDRICQVQLQAADYRQSQQESEMRRSLLADLLASHQSAMWDRGDVLVKSLLLNQPWPDGERMQTVLQLETYAHQSDLLTANIEICETRLASLQTLKSGLSEQIRESCGVPLTTLRLERAKQELADLESRQSQLSVVSPASGQVGVYRSRTGDVLQPGDPIVELLDDSQRFLAAEVPSTRIHEFKAGRAVTLEFPGDERRQGRVSRVAPQTRPRDAAQPLADPLVQVDIEQVGRLWPTVPIGTRVNVLPAN